MSFWSGERLEQELPQLISPFDKRHIDFAAYTLALGDDVFITTDQRIDDSPDKGLRTTLTDNQECRIPPGQFAFLSTEERIRVPPTAIGWISMRARYKFKGLVNVSGFHVDPGWDGKLVFGIYNAGPAPVVLSRGTRLFLIWYADLDQPSNKIRSVSSGTPPISDEMVAGMSGQVFSPIALSKDVQELKETAIELREDISERSFSVRLEIAKIQAEQSFYKKLLLGAIFVVAGVVLREAWPYLFGAGSAVTRPMDITITDKRPVLVPQTAPPTPQEANRQGANSPASNPGLTPPRPAANISLPPATAASSEPKGKIVTP
jgi:dCTP deaminase